MGDFKAKVGKEQVEDVVTEHGSGIRTDRLIHFCQETNLAVMNSWFKLPPKRLYTWKSPQDIKTSHVTK